MIRYVPALIKLPSRQPGLTCAPCGLLCPELPENWTDTRETLLEGMVFQLKYLGVTLVEQPKGEELSAAAVKRIVATVSQTHGRACTSTCREDGDACARVQTHAR